MASVIWKFELDGGSTSDVMMPVGATVLSVGIQNDNIFLWALVDNKAPLQVRRFRIVGTGWVEPALQQQSCIRFIQTVQNPPLVWHVFEVPGPEPTK